MKYAELKKLTNAEIEKKVKELKMELIKSNASKASGKAKQIKKIFARINTLSSSKIGGKK